MLLSLGNENWFSFRSLQRSDKKDSTPKDFLCGLSSVCYIWYFFSATSRRRCSLFSISPTILSSAVPKYSVSAYFLLFFPFLSLPMRCCFSHCRSTPYFRNRFKRYPLCPTSRAVTTSVANTRMKRCSTSSTDIGLLFSFIFSSFLFFLFS